MMLVQEPIQAAIWHCLNHYAFVDATFLAERLLSEVDSEEALHLLATSYYRSGKIGRAYTILRMHGFATPQLKYLMAKCCYELGKLDEAESTLTGGSVLRPKQIDDLVSEFGSIACFALQLLGLICAKTERAAKATEALRRSLKLNPFLWHSFAALCDNGDKPDPTKVFKLDLTDNFCNIHGNTVYSLFNNAENNSNVITNSDSIVMNNTLSNVSMNTPIGENNHQTQQIQHMTIHSLQQTPNITPLINTPIIVPSITPMPMQQSISIISTPVQHSLSVLNTPVTVNVTPAPDSGDSFESVPKMKKCVRFQRMFGNPSCLSPITPSFGVLPLDLSLQTNDSEGSMLNSSLAILTPSPLTVSQLDTQSINKLNNIGFGKRILCRNISKDPTLVINKPAVFAPAGNNNYHQSPPTGQAYVRRSSRLFGNSSSVKENNKNRFVPPKSPARKTKTRSSKSQNSLSELNEKNKCDKHDIITSSEKSLSEKPITINLSQQAVTIQKQSAEGLMNLLKDMGSAYLQLSQFDCRKAIETFSLLPPQHYQTGWVLSHLAKSYFEMNDYNEAVRYFSEVREKEPYSLELMEYFSTALWHLQKEVQLSALAQDVIEVDRECAQAWCAAGNCFSLQKEHEAAIKFFSRAIQVDPNFAYAYTLLGHEHLATEELDRALSCYRSAVRIDPRHYNAWYGIGLVLFKQERFTQAEWYFKKAVGIHPQCSVLLCHVAVVEHTLQKSSAALLTLKKALSIDPRNPLCKYHKASILHALDYNQEALKELLQLKEIVPKESNVYFLLGKVYKRLGDTHLALMNFSWAMDLDPKGANNQFKEAIDPAINCFPPEEEDNINNNPQENVSEASSSLMAAESSQESLILEPSSDNPQNSGMEEHPLSTSLSASILGPSSGVSAASSNDNNASVTSLEIPSSSNGLAISSSGYGLMTAPATSSLIPTLGSCPRISTQSSFGDLPSPELMGLSWISGSRTISRNRRTIPPSRISPSPSIGSTSSSSGIQLSLSSPSISTSGPSSSSSSGNVQVSSYSCIGSNRPTVRFSEQRLPVTPQLSISHSNSFDYNRALASDNQLLGSDAEAHHQHHPRSGTPIIDINEEIL